MNELQSTNTLERYALSLGAAFVATVTLFLIMQASIAEGHIAYDPVPSLPTVSMVPRLDDEPIVVKETIVPKPTPPELMPDPPVLPRTIDGGGGTFVLAEPTAEIGSIKQIGGAGEGDLLPIMRVQPEYPQRALLRGTEGWVIVEFIVDELGRVLEPRVIEASPAGVFDRAAVKAVLRYKYKPRVLNGEPQVVNGVRQRIVFSLS